VLVAPHQQRLDPLVFAVGGQVGADVERLAAAGRDRHHAAKDVGVADRPGHDRQQQGRDQQPGPGQAGAPAARSADPDRGKDDEGCADEQVLGPEHRGQSEQEARQQPGPQVLAFARPEEGEHRRWQSEDRRRLAHQLAGGVDEGWVDGDGERRHQADG